jgi:SHS2 domain-containing protein
MPFQEIQHTADWSMHVWAESLPALFVDSARGMNSLAGVRLSDTPRIHREFSIRATDTESLLVAFLSELVYYTDKENVAFDTFNVEINGDRIAVEMKGAPLMWINKAIKAVTYHRMAVRQTMRGFEVELVFDV